MSHHIHKIERALEHAKEKHPFFAHHVHAPVAGFVHRTESTLRLMRACIDVAIDNSNLSAHDLLLCELAEAMVEYAKHDYAACLEELAQCAAVIIRMMEMVVEEGAGK